MSHRKVRGRWVRDVSSSRDRVQPTEHDRAEAEQIMREIQELEQARRDGIRGPRPSPVERPSRS